MCIRDSLGIVFLNFKELSVVNDSTDNFVHIVRLVRIVSVIDGGKIVESGTHEMLMNKKGIYYNLFVHQT